MDDLIPFLIFIVIALVNLVKFVLEKKGGKKPGAPSTPGEKPKRSSLEEFFEEVREKFEPQPTPVPDWPEGYERPDYLNEQEEYEVAQQDEPAEKPAAEIIPMPEPVRTEVPAEEIHAVSVKSAMTAMPAVAAGMSNIRMPSASMMKGGSGGSINYSLKKKSELRKAIIANIVFSKPRAYDTSFENTSL